MPVGVAPHYRPIACWSVSTATAILLVECRCKKDGYKYGATFTSDMSADPVPLSDMPACTMHLCQTCMMGLFIQIRVFVKCFSIRQGIRSVLNPSDMATGNVPLPQICKTCRLPSWTPS